MLGGGSGEGERLTCWLPVSHDAASSEADGVMIRYAKEERRSSQCDRWGRMLASRAGCLAVLPRQRPVLGAENVYEGLERKKKKKQGLRKPFVYLC